MKESSFCKKTYSSWKESIKTSQNFIKIRTRDQTFKKIHKGLILKVKLKISRFQQFCSSKMMKALFLIDLKNLSHMKLQVIVSKID